ncbi:MAG: pilus assembly protein PilB [Zetaproteobacteria bacterium CG12_big_fil_rev_8_21_14_0_65_54_13]|nr:MAG: pilus assembly protein PilB [Zetaproteobacteria bacterium CG12_big_fil_rev_8_21_14_0_65_54_13]PIX54273.1 MAG: pilus assembly protein PilB [Zetaproteobacteria bacterium CG_4_10_14_3_um_filter_54_28]PJA30418.1 MAG: pilus assembly protein PilB [Zetaproteobacteria bacterium CG_4_9_14_3_um_filter_54_145]
MQLKYQRQLIQSGVLTEAQLTEAEALALARKKSLFAALLEMDSVDDDLLLTALSRLYKTSYIDISKTVIDPKLMEICPEKLCLKYAFVPVGQNETDIVIATASPLDVSMLDALGFKLGRRIVPRLARPDLILRKISESYQDSESAFSAAMDDLDDEHALTQEMEDTQQTANLDELKRGAEDSPIIKLVNGVIVQAMKIGSSDIHIEPGDKQSVVRLRVDGRLRPMIRFPSKAHPLVVSRIKIMSRLDISNTRTPQDGRARVKMLGKSYDMRISTLPAMHGEKVVMRILDQGGLALSLDVLCFESTAYKHIRQCIEQPTGAVLVTGPTGSGKTTTLYSFLHHIKNEEMNLITIEDPVEFQIEGINQVQVNPKSGMTFSAVLRSILRQDPDVVMVGEIRDEETAEIALHAAQTGHLVLSTLHTNDAPSTVTRLLDMGIEPTMLASSLNLIVAQRLVRRLCPKCRVETKPSADMIARLGIPEGVVFYDKAGCKHCLNIGYKGRMGVHEVLYVSERIRKLIARGATDRELMQAAREEDMLTLFEDGLSKALSGQTSLPEILRVCTFPEGFVLADHLDENQQLLSFGEVQRRRDKAHARYTIASDQQTVLVVDDSSSVRNLVEFVLDADGYKVMQAEDGQQAWNMLQRMKPNLVLTDCEMPNMSGMELLKQMREHDRFDDVPVILLTARRSEEDEVAGLKAGAADYIGKPVEPLKLQARVRKTLALYEHIYRRGMTDGQ